MKLSELNPEFLKREDDHSFRFVDTIAEASGIMFLCPRCWTRNKGPQGTHFVICWGPSVPQSTTPAGGRWALVGSGFHDLSLVAGSSSVLLPGPKTDEEREKGSPCGWHGFVKNGEILGI